MARPLSSARPHSYFGPARRSEVSAILKRANETRTAIVPQGGNTGLVGGQIPFESGHEVLVALERLNRVRDIDLASNTMTVEAGSRARARANRWRQAPGACSP